MIPCSAAQSVIPSGMREELAHVLDRHHPADQKEAADLARMRELLETLADPFSRTADPTHFTASAVVLDPMMVRTGLVHHARLGRWLQPGGHFEPEDRGDHIRAALREAREETGCTCRAATGLIDVDIHPIPARGDRPAHLHLDLRIIAIAEDPENAQHDPGESLGFEWLFLDAAIERVDDASLRRLLRKAREFSGQERSA